MMLAWAIAHWRVLVTAASIALAGLAGWRAGAERERAGWEARAAEQARIDARETLRRSENALRASDAREQRVERVRTTTRTIVQRIHDAPHPAADCPVPGELVMLHDAAAAAELPEPVVELDDAGATPGAPAGQP